MKVYIINLVLFAMELRRLSGEFEMIFSQEIEELKSIVIKRFSVRNLEFKLTQACDLKSLDLDLLNIY